MIALRLLRWDKSLFASQVTRIMFLVCALIILQSSPAQAQWTTSGNNINNTNTGNVGIGTTSPNEILEIKATYPSIRATMAGATGYAAFRLYAQTTEKARYAWNSDIGTYIFDVSGLGTNFLKSDGSSSVFINNSGNVGIGTTSPEAKFSVGATPTGGNTPTTGVFNLSADSPNGVIVRRGGVTYPQELKFGVNQASLYSEIQAVQASVAVNTLVLNGSGGNVGIGTTTPSEKLEILGNIKVSGNINAKYQDVAEWVESSQALPAGTVVVLDHTKSNQVVSSTQSYDTRVAGVISAQPGIALGESGVGRVLVATTGRVRVHVDATKGPIQIGDLLVTSNTPGLAMKSEPVKLGGVELHRPGTLIGKALEPLEKGSGQILVLLSLQ